MRARRPTSEDEERQPAIATRVVEFLEQKKAAYLAKQQHTKKQRHAYDQQKSKTPARKKVLARARKKFQRRHSSKILRDQKKRRHTIKLRRVRARRNPDPPRILLAGTDSVVTLDELKHPRFIVDSPRHGRSTERLPYADPQADELTPYPPECPQSWCQNHAGTAAFGAHFRPLHMEVPSYRHQTRCGVRTSVSYETCGSSNVARTRRFR